VQLADYRLAWPLVIFWTFFSVGAAPYSAARLAFARLSLRDVRFSFLRSVAR